MKSPISIVRVRVRPMRLREAFALGDGEEDNMFVRAHDFAELFHEHYLELRYKGPPSPWPWVLAPNVSIPCTDENIFKILDWMCDACGMEECHWTSDWMARLPYALLMYEEGLWDACAVAFVRLFFECGMDDPSIERCGPAVTAWCRAMVDFGGVWPVEDGTVGIIKMPAKRVFK